MTDTPKNPEPDENPTDPLRRADEPPMGDDGPPAGGDEAPAGGDLPPAAAGDPLGRGDEASARGDLPPAAAGDDPFADEPERPAGAASSGRSEPLFAGFAVEDDPPPRRLTRSSSDRLVAGVAGGLGRHFNVDPLAIRIAFVVLTFAGGFGVLAYLVGLIAMPAEDQPGPLRWGLARTIGAGLLAAAALGALLPNWFWGPELPALVVFGVVAYLLVRVIRDDGGTHLGRVAARIALGIALLSLAAAGFAAAAAGTALGGGILISGLVIALGVGLVGGAFRGGARWLMVPAFLLALPLGVVSAADLELKGDWGDRTYRPLSAAELAEGYRMGAAHMRIDLRDVDLPPGRTEVPVELGVGELEVAVPPDVCVTYDVEVGAGQVTTLDGISNGGVDLDVVGDAAVPAGVRELHVNADVGLGEVRIGPQFISRGDGTWRDWDRTFGDATALNTACRGAS
jgi:phage shock protein PspC (stress-responsive transcriptional regulator)